MLKYLITKLVITTSLRTQAYFGNVSLYPSTPLCRYPTKYPSCIPRVLSIYVTRGGGGGVSGVL